MRTGSDAGVSTIVHVTTGAQWAAAQSAGAYRGDTLASEGFIHCSRPDQVAAVGARFFRGASGLLLLVIDRERVVVPVRDEGADGDLFPHIYGPLNLDAVTRVLPFEPRADGGFDAPAFLA
jgi:uncharacterized protein (DUF952 family)